jgi:hypothetical protein
VSKHVTHHIGTLNTYTAKAKVDGTGFNAEITGDGIHHTILAIPTEAAVNGWIAQDKRRTKLKISLEVQPFRSLLVATLGKEPIPHVHANHRRNSGVAKAGRPDGRGWA